MNSLADLALALRELRRRQARLQGLPALTYRQLAARAGWSHGIIGEYLAGRVLPPTDRFDVLVRMLGATPAEQGVLATARDRVEEGRRNANSTTSRLDIPRQLPAEAFGFTGRREQLNELDALLDQGMHDPAVVISAVSGTAGVGKTTLAVRWAHRVKDRFPDGQFYVDLRGYDQDQPVSAGAALARLIRSLGVASTDIPADVDECAAYYRTLLASRRMLVLLDNASGADHVRPLLPGTQRCLVLITSRDNLAGLVAREGAHRIDLDVLSETEAVALLRTVIGKRVAADPAAAADLVQQCARLPLALRIAAEAAVARPETSLANLASELRGNHNRLDQLSAPGDPRAAVRTVFSWSYQRLTAKAAQVFGLLGLHPGRDLDLYDVAALSDSDLASAQAAVDELAQAHLIEAAGRDRFAMHDLLRAYAAECAPDRHAPLSRLLGYYAHTAAIAADTLFPHDQTCRPQDTSAATPLPHMAGPAEALSWLDSHRANLVAVARFAASNGWPWHSVELSRVLWRHFEVGGHYQEALTVHSCAEQAARSDPDGAAGHGLPGVLANLGNIHWWLGDYQDALTYFQQALTGHRAACDRDGEARALARLGIVHERLGSYEHAVAHLQEALAIYRAISNQHGVGAQLLNLGTLYRRYGHYPQAATHHEQAAHLFAQLGDRRLEGYALGNLGVDYGVLGRHTDALDHLHRALAHCKDSADPGGQASASAAIGAVFLRMGQFPKALEQLHIALAISRDTSDRALETEVLNGLGETLRAAGEMTSSLEHHKAALALALRSGDQYEHARALGGMAQVCMDEGKIADAREQWQQALAIYTRLGVPEAQTLRTKLNTARH